MSKTPLPERIESGDTAYQLIYIPGLPADANPRYCVPPPARDWNPLTGGTKEVLIHGREKRYLGWLIMQQPAVPGTAMQARNYLFLLFDKLPVTQALMDPQRNMICYAMTPVNPQAADPIQAFVDAMFGAPQPTAKETPVDWVSDLFSVPEASAEAGDKGSGEAA